MDPKKTFIPKRVLLVDDDPVIVHLYQRGLTRLGFEVSSAPNGLAAMQALRDSTPDAVVLDLMMPKFSGAEVLRFLRDRPETHSVPVIILSNAYMDPLVHDAARLGANRGLAKFTCTPASLAAVLRELLEGLPFGTPQDQLLAAPAEAIPVPPRHAPPTDAAASVPPPPQETSPAPDQSTEPRQRAREALAAHSVAVTHKLRESYQSLLHSREERERNLRLEAFYRQVHFVTSAAGLAGYQATAQMAAALEALLFGMMDRPLEISPSLDRTISMGLDLLLELLGKAEESVRYPTAPTALVVDDDRLSNRLAVTALRNAHVQAKGTEDPELALRWLQQGTYDLILLDVEMPGMDGFELCKRLRTLPGYEKTPVIYVTLHSDFETRTRTMLSGGNDLIAKPILPAELAVKAVLHLLKHG